MEFRVSSINCTLLTVDRLRAISAAALAREADILLIQETKHYVSNPKGLTAVAASLGWHTHWSSPVDTTEWGGCAVFWRTHMGRGAPVTLDSTRHAIYSWPFLTIASCYGDAKGLDLGPIHLALQTVADHPTPVHIVAGDLNWKPHWSWPMPPGWSRSPAKPSTASDTAPTRVLAHGYDVSTLESFRDPVADIRHHCLFTFSVAAHGPVPLQETRERKVGLYHWERPLTPQEEDTMEYFLSEHPPADPEVSLFRAWQSWHHRAEFTFKVAAGMGAAYITRKPERPKGSRPTFRPCSAASHDRPLEPIALRRLRRLHRRTAELLHTHMGADPISCPRLRRSLECAVHENLLPGFPDSVATGLGLLAEAISHHELLLKELRGRRWKANFCSEAMQDALPPLVAGTPYTLDADPAAPSKLYSHEWSGPVFRFADIQRIPLDGRAVVAVNTQAEFDAVAALAPGRFIAVVFLHHPHSDSQCWVWQGDSFDLVFRARYKLFIMAPSTLVPTKKPAREPLAGLRKAQQVLRPMSALPTFTAQQVRDQWDPIWSPGPKPEWTRAWQGYMDEACPGGPASEASFGFLALRLIARRFPPFRAGLAGTVGLPLN